MFILKALFVMAIAYLLGSVSFAYIITKWKLGEDIRNLGSGNAGFTNTLRVLPKKWAYTVFAGDCLKGSLAAFIGHTMLGPIGGVLAAVCVILGHMYPCFFQFKGGKGVATAFGVGMVLVTWPAIFSIMLFGIAVLATRYVSVGSMVGVCSSFFISLFMGYPTLYVLVCFFLSVSTIYKHRENISRLRAGTERKVGQK